MRLELSGSSFASTNAVRGVKIYLRLDKHKPDGQKHILIMNLLEAIFNFLVKKKEWR